jgi:hypothetical protein
MLRRRHGCSPCLRYLRLPRFRRARLRCFLPGGPSGEPAGVLLSPFGFGFAIRRSYAPDPAAAEKLSAMRRSHLRGWGAAGGA